VSSVYRMFHRERCLDGLRRESSAPGHYDTLGDYETVIHSYWNHIHTDICRGSNAQCSGIGPDISAKSS
jgi:hypothetical protein